MTMSDRIAVLNDGQIEQFGTPNEIFKYPENEFVGQFIGNYGMNVLTADVVEFTDEDATLVLDDREFVLQFDERHGTMPSDRVRLGFRPERTSLDGSENAILSGEITLLETFGEETVATIDTDIGTINAVIPSEANFTEDQSIEISIDRTRAHLFDYETGEVIAHTN